MITKKNKKILQQFLALAPDPEFTFTYDELLGYIFGLAMTPDIVLPSEWLPIIFDNKYPDYDSEKQAEKMLRCLIEVYNSFTADFHNNALDFPFTEEFLMTDRMEKLYEWVSGLEEALALRDEFWDPIEYPKLSEQKKEELYYAMMVVQGLADPVEVEEFFAAMPEEIFQEAFPDTDNDGEKLDHNMRVQALLIASLPLSVQTLQDHAHTVEKKRQRTTGNHTIHQLPVRAAKVNRNEPYPCNSGKKCCETPTDISHFRKKKSNVIQGNFPQYGKKQTADVPAPTPAPSTSNFQLKIGLKNATPPIWRRILVEEKTTLARLHEIIQIAMGWTNSHLHMFIIDQTFYCPPDRDDDRSHFESKNEAHFTLRDLKEKIHHGFQYVYDFGDDWMHQITVEKTLLVEKEQNSPVVLAGRRTCPPEDIGGIYGYMRALEVLQDPEDEEYQELCEWLGEDFDPALFRKAQITEINAILKKLA